MSEASSGESNGNSDYVKSHENLPTILAKTPKLARHIHKIQNIHEVPTVDIKKFSQLTELFTQTNEVDPT